MGPSQAMRRTASQRVIYLGSRSLILCLVRHISAFTL